MNEIVKMGWGYLSDVEVVESYNSSKKVYSNTGDTIWYSVKAVSLKTNIGRNTIYAMLRKSQFLDENNIPLPKYVDEGYFIYSILHTRYSHKGVIKVSHKGIDLILSL